MDMIIDTYDTVFYEKADPRLKDWLLMRSPWPAAIILATYMLLIKAVLPSYMKSRPPYQLKGIIRAYNIFQIIANTWICWGIMTSGWTTTLTFGCELPDYSNNPEPVRMLTFLWWNSMLKFVELVETLFFILRKKDDQASFLHVYHHVSSAILMWFGAKFVGGGITSFPPMLNCGVHVIMYVYYFLSSDGSPAVKAFLNKYKKWLTVLQIIQFNIILVHTSQVFLPSCKAPLALTTFFFPTVFIVYYNFVTFFKAKFIKTNDKKLQNGKKVD